MRQAATGPELSLLKTGTTSGTVNEPALPAVNKHLQPYAGFIWKFKRAVHIQLLLVDGHQVLKDYPGPYAVVFPARGELF